MKPKRPSYGPFYTAQEPEAQGDTALRKYPIIPINFDKITKKHMRKLTADCVQMRPSYSDNLQVNRPVGYAATNRVSARTH